MIILIDGVTHAGKTLMAQRLMERYHIPYYSIDHLKMGLFRAGGDCGFTPLSGDEHIGGKLWPILKGIIMTAVENRQSLIIEGVYLLPEKIRELPGEYLREIIELYLLFSRVYVERRFESHILRYDSAIEHREDQTGEYARNYILQSESLKARYRAADARYFEIADDYERDTGAAYAWIDAALAKRQ